MAFFTDAVERDLRESRIPPDTAARIIERVEAAVPHLRFRERHYWDGEPSRGVSGSATFPSADRRTLVCRIQPGGGRVFESLAHLDGATVPPEDRVFLGPLLEEAARAIRDSARTPQSLSEFGFRSVATFVNRLAHLEFDSLQLLHFLRSLGAQTYENQRIAYGIILTDEERDGESFLTAFDNKRIKRLTDGYSTALVLSRTGAVIGLASLPPPPEVGDAARRRPLWLGPLAHEAHRRNAVGVALTRGGDLFVTERGRLRLSLRAGQWRLWRHRIIIDFMKGLWHSQGRSSQLAEVVSHLFQVALDLSFRRSGGLLVVASSRRAASELVASPRDLLGSEDRSGVEASLDGSLAERVVHGLDRRVVADLASLDGAVVVDRTGRLLAYGAMVKSSRRHEQGARTRASVAASRSGLAIKVSSDGDISIYRNGEEYLRL